MLIIQEQNKLELWNKLHFKEKKTESIHHVWNIRYLYLLNKYTRWFKYDWDFLCVNCKQSVPVIFEPSCIKCNFGGWRCGTSTIVDVRCLKVNISLYTLVKIKLSTCSLSIIWVMSHFFIICSTRWMWVVSFMPCISVPNIYSVCGSISFWTEFISA